MTQIFAHRGFSYVAPENTVSAFLCAMDIGVDGFELDVHLTSDHELVVIHDETVDRTTNGSGWVKDFTLKEIKLLDAGGWFSKEFENEKIPRLEEVFELVQNTDLTLNIELKNNVIAYPGIEKKVVDAINSYDLQDQVIISSFNHVCLVHLRSDYPHIPLGLLYDAHISECWAYAERLGVGAIHPHYPLVEEEIVRKCHEYGIAVRPYTVDSIIDARRLMDCKVDALITNVPDRIQSIFPS